MQGFVLVFVVAISALGGIPAFRERRLPEPPNDRRKLPVALLCLIASGLLLLAGEAVVLMALVLAMSVAVIRYRVKGRNPWWMQTANERRRRRLAAPQTTD